MPAVVEGRHHHQVNAHLIPVAGRHLFQMSPFLCVEQPRAVEYTLHGNLFCNLFFRSVNYRRSGRRHRQHRRSQKRQHSAHHQSRPGKKAPFYFAIFRPVYPCHIMYPKISRMISSGRKMEENRISSFPLSTGSSPQTFPVWPFMAK